MAQLSNTVNHSCGSCVSSYSDLVISKIPKTERVFFSTAGESYFGDYNNREGRMARQGTAIKGGGGHDTTAAKDWRKTS